LPRVRRPGTIRKPMSDPSKVNGGNLRDTVKDPDGKVGSSQGSLHKTDPLGASVPAPMQKRKHATTQPLGGQVDSTGSLRARATERIAPVPQHVLASAASASNHSVQNAGERPAPMRPGQKPVPGAAEDDVLGRLLDEVTAKDPHAETRPVRPQRPLAKTAIVTQDAPPNRGPLVFGLIAGVGIVAAGLLYWQRTSSASNHVMQPGTAATTSVQNTGVAQAKTVEPHTSTAQPVPSIQPEASATVSADPAVTTKTAAGSATEPPASTSATSVAPPSTSAKSVSSAPSPGIKATSKAPAVEASTSAKVPKYSGLLDDDPKDKKK
jgi:hypothetical protein